jgi:hypothetical protein
MPRDRRYTTTLAQGALLLGVIALLAFGVGSSAARPNSGHASGAVSGPLIVGLAEGASGWGGASAGTRLAQLTASGARWLRETFQWGTIEPRPGKFSWSYYDNYMLQASKRGVHPIALLDGAPGWAAPTPISVPKNPTVYAKYVAAVVGRYGENGSFWRAHSSLKRSAIRVYELWNEPYFSNGNGGYWSPARYARLVKAASIAGHKQDRGAKFLLEADMAAHLSRVWGWWVDDLYRAMPDLNKYFNGVAVHDYGSDVTHSPRIIPGQPYDGFGHVRRIQNIRQQFVSHGGANKPFWIMEAGWSTCTQQSIDCVRAQQQVKNFKTFFGYVRGIWKGWVQAALIYRYQDGSQPDTVQDGYGLVYGNGGPKPAFWVFEQQVALSPR